MSGDPTTSRAERLVEGETAGDREMEERSMLALRYLEIAEIFLACVDLKSYIQHYNLMLG